MLAALEHPAFLVDTAGIIRLCNAPAEALLPRPLPRPTGAAFAAFLQRAGLPALWAMRPPELARAERLEAMGRLYDLVQRPILSGGAVAGRLVELKECFAVGSTQERLQAVSRQLQVLSGCIEISSDGICILDNQGVILYLNPVYERITGLKRDALMGRNMRDMVAEGVFDQAASLKALEIGRPATLPLKLSSGKSVLVSATPLLDENGAISRVVCSIRDVTELNRLQQELDSVAALKTLYEEELRDLKKNGSHGRPFAFRSEAMRRIVELALRLGPVDATVLLQGESGVGKEVIADFLQKNSLRRDKPFIKVNCAAIPENLLESELFGYARGAFTGANREGKVGIFEAANQGTLLLDEVGELSPALQVKLLRVLQDKTVLRIGDTVGREVDVRILAATNRDLAAMVEHGGFRKDLYYRINVVPICIPPLRERKEDIVSLIQIFLKRFNERYNTDKRLHPRARQVFLEYAWPGNVRELENIIERLVVTSPASTLHECDLPDHLFRRGENGLSFTLMRGKSLKEIMDEHEAMILRRCFSEYGTTRAVAAALGIHQSNVVRKARRLNLRDLVADR